MRLYSETLLSLLRPALVGVAVEQVAVGAHDLQLTCGALRMRNALRVDFSIAGVEHVWSGDPCDAPVWLLAGQTATDVALDSLSALRVTFASGDWLRLHTDERPYETQIFQWPDREDGATVMEIF